jgi:hypothetical protein
MKKDAMNNEQKDSREATDGLHDSSVAKARPARPPDDSDSDSDLIMEVGAQLYEAISRLRAVRVPGKPKLTMQEAMDAAEAQYESYRRWKSRGGPLGKMKAWVEGEEVFKALGPPVFGNFNINWPALNEGVLQITTEYEQEQIVLYNLRLHDVPRARTVYDERLPDGQHLVLTVTRYVTLAAAAGSSSSSRTEGFAINIAIQPRPGAIRSFAIADLLDLSKENGKRREDKEETKNSRPKLSVMSDRNSSRPRWTSRVAYAVVVALLGFLIFQTESLKSLIKSTVTAQNKASESKAGVQMAINEQPEVQEDSRKAASISASSLPESSPMIADVNTIRKIPVKIESLKHHRATASWQINDIETVAVYPPKESEIITIAASELPKTELLENNTDERLTRYRELEGRMAAIATLQSIPVRVQSSEMTQAAKTERLRSLFAQAFEASPRFKVLNDSDQSKAALVIGLRFEAAERTSGFVFVDIRDSNGKFIWQDFANCMQSRPNETFIVDARGLVSSLEQVMSASR